MPTLNSQRLVHAFTALATYIVILSGIYLVWQLNVIVIVLSAILIVATAYRFRPRTEPHHAEPTDPPAFAPRFLFITFLSAEAIIAALLLLSRTDSAIVSPWDVLPSSIFIAYAVASFFLLFILRIGTRHPALLLSIHAANTWGVALAVYALGFGFDPFIHQATERYIREFGSISPKQPFYLGQYVLVVALNTLTRLPIRLIDQFLVPFLAVATIPFAFLSAKRAPIGIAALFLLTLMQFTVTTPFHFAVLFLVLSIAILPHSGTRRTDIALIFFGLAALACHPLIGLPTLILTGVTVLGRHMRIRWRAIHAMLLTASLLVGAMLVYAALHHAWPSWPDVGMIRDSLRALFGNPYPGSSPFFLTSFYKLVHVWPLVMICFAGWGYWKTKTFTADNALLASVGIGAFIAAIAIGVFIRLPDIIADQQFEFPLRLFMALPLFFLPGIMTGVDRLFHSSSPTGMRSVSVCAVLAVIISGVWQTLYPQHNAVAHYTAPSMGRDDVVAVRLIDADADGFSYAVLSHQLLSAAWLREFGFDRQIRTADGPRNPYAIPTGGELYGLYLTLLHSEDTDAVIADAFRYMDVRRLYVALPRTWDPENKADEHLRSSAVRVIERGTLRVYVFLSVIPAEAGTQP